MQGGIENTPGSWDRHWSGTHDRYNRHHTDIWAALAPYVGEGLWVDLGCGPAAFWTHYDGRFVGVDSSRVGLQKAVSAVPHGIYIHADARNIPVPDEQFDGVMLSGLLDYFMDDWRPLLKEARRIGKRGAPIVFTLLHGFEGHVWDSKDRVAEKVGHAALTYEVVGNWRVCVV